jgi:hypothetical protein
LVEQIDLLINLELTTSVGSRSVICRRGSNLGELVVDDLIRWHASGVRNGRIGAD